LVFHNVTFPVSLGPEDMVRKRVITILYTLVSGKFATISLNLLSALSNNSLVFRVSVFRVITEAFFRVGAVAKEDVMDC
jgi:hypothetical protein